MRKEKAHNLGRAEIEPLTGRPSGSVSAGQGSTPLALWVSGRSWCLPRRCLYKLLREKAGKRRTSWRYDRPCIRAFWRSSSSLLVSPSHTEQGRWRFGSLRMVSKPANEADRGLRRSLHVRTLLGFGKAMRGLHWATVPTKQRVDTAPSQT
jgi:hypothetical protein